MVEPIKAPGSKPHGNLLGETARVRLCGGPFIDVHTLSDLKVWQARGTSYGVAIDRLVRNANSIGFDPVTESFVKQTKSRTPFPAQKTKNRTTPKS